MAKSPRIASSSAHESVGITSDGVRVLKPKTKPTHFTSGQIRSTIRQVLKESGRSQGVGLSKGQWRKA